MISMRQGISVTRTFTASRQRVWEAWTRPEVFAEWFGTAAVEVPWESLSMDVRPGGDWHAVMRSPGAHDVGWHGTFAEVDPPARLAMTITEDDGPGEEPENPVTVDLEEVPGGTEMTLTRAGRPLSEEQQREAQAGWGEFLDAMEDVLHAA